MDKIKDLVKCLGIAIVLFLGVMIFIPATDTKVKESKESYVINRDEIIDVLKLATIENQFTDSLEYSTSKKFPLIRMDIPGTRNQLSAKIDGTLVIGMDAEKIEVRNSYNNQGQLDTITVYLPSSEILYMHIEEEVLEQNNGFLNNNPVNVEDYEKKKDALVEEHKELVIQNGILEKSDEKVRQIIQDYVTGITNGEVKVTFEVLK